METIKISRDGETMKTKYHLRLDIRGALLNWDMRMFRGMFKADDGRTMEPQEAKLLPMDELQKGNNYIPYGDCEGFDPKENGCPGHPVVAVAEVER